MTRKFIVATSMLLLTGALWAADDKKEPASVEAAIQKGLKDYKDSKPQDAIAALQEAISLIQKSAEKGLGSYFPAAPDGWEASEIESHSMAGMGSGKDAGISWTQISRTYTRKSDKMTVRMELTNAPQLIDVQKGMAEMYKNPQMLAAMNADGKTTVKPFDQSGWTGWTKIEKDKDAELTTFSKGNLLTIHVSKADETALQQFIGLMNFKAMGEGSVAASKPAK